MRALVLSLALTALAAAETCDFTRGLPAGWTTTGDSGWATTAEGLAVRSETPGALAWWRLAPRSTVQLEWRLRSPAETGRRGLSFGLSDGEPTNQARRLWQLALQADGAVAWFDGQRWRPLTTWLPATDMVVRVTVDGGGGTALIDLPLPAGGRLERHIPLWNQTGRADTIFLTNTDPERTGPTLTLLREVLVATPPTAPTAPRLTLERVGATAVRLFWSRVPEARGYVVRRDGAVVARVGPERSLWLDQGLPTATEVGYTVTAVGAGTSAEARLQTGPVNEVLPANGRFDVVVYGATPGGLAAAVTLGRQGRRVALIAPDDNLGGMITGGLGRTDFGSIHALGGLFKQFIDEVADDYRQRYGADSADARVMRDGLYFEPHVARRIFLRWLESAPTVTLLRNAHLVGVRSRDAAVRAVVIADRDRAVRRVLEAEVFIDASYEGDLAAYAGASYLIGREAREAYGEQYAGKLWWDVWERRIVQVEGTGDRIVQAYCYRLCLTRDVDLRLPPPPPAVYDRERYLTLLPDIRAGKLKSLKDVLSILQLPGSKADANNHPQGHPSSDLIGGADEYPEATHARRRELAREHVDHILGLLWFLRHDSEVPEEFRRDAQQWGLARDEFPETGGWPAELYVREGRRILGREVFTEAQAMAVPGGVRPPNHPDSIAVGAYPIDSHATGGRHPEHPDWLEGFFYLARGETKPYQIAYGVMLPEGFDNLLVCGCVSSTHVGYGTLRMEPVFMALGTAAGVAADLALAARQPPRRIDIRRVQRELLARRQVITVFEDVTFDTPGWAGFQLLGTRGVFPTYEARPTEPLTGVELAAWLEGLGWPATRTTRDAAAAYAGSLDPATLRRLLSRLARDLGQPVPTDWPAEVTRGSAMACLWTIIAPAL